MRKVLGAAAFGGALLAAGATQAATVVLQNGDFSQGYAQADGDYGAGHAGRNPTGWSGSGGSGTGHWNPTTASFSDEAAHGGVGWAHGLGVSNQANAGMLAQVVQGHTVQANTRYTLTMDVGNRLEGDGPWAYEIGLLAGALDGTGVIFAELVGGAEIAAGTFGRVSLMFETGASDAFLGQQLAILLSGTGRGAAFDNVVLEATPLVASAVPEPATWAMMIAGFGGVGAMVRSRRRQAAFA